MSGGGDEDKKPNAADQHINLKVKAQLEMEEGDEIDAMLHQTGGGGGDMPNTGDQGAHIHLKVKGQGGNEVFFRIKRGTQLKKLMNAYCDRQSVKLYSVVFLYEGRRLLGEQTPHELEMEEGDEIDAMLHQTGVSGAGGDEAKTGDQGAHILLKVKGQLIAEHLFVADVKHCKVSIQESQLCCESTRNDDVTGLFYECLTWTVIDMGVVITNNGVEGVRFMKWVGGNEVFFRMRRSTRLKKLMNAYCDRQSVELNSIVFLYEGRRLLGEQTPHELEMEQDDEIYAMPHMTGGIYEDLQMKLSAISV
ncbi:hypothetical protein CTI12_AA622980 [Artemisia annua]|uniref:Ubiquitin-like domain-containing protein n=1 Tax=Artemisia annua TaxID=35608 RepID=A0A2U1KBA1_ARTAN|nr:hypothetical protein CTI12_AA622980 [Artemisia annua]